MEQLALDEHVLESLKTITGLDDVLARRLLESSNGNLQEAVERHLSNSEQSTSHAGRHMDTAHVANLRGAARPLLRSRLPLQDVLTQLSTNLTAIVSNAVSGLLIFLKGLFVPPGDDPHLANFAQSFRVSLGDTANESRNETLTFARGPITQAFVTAVTTCRPCFVIALDGINFYKSNGALLRQTWAAVMRDEGLKEIINTNCIVHGFDMNVSLSNRLVARMLQWKTDATAAISISLPLRLHADLAVRYRRLLRQDAAARLQPDSRDMSHGMQYENVWTIAEQESLFEAIQSIFLSLSSDPSTCPPAGDFRLDIVKGGSIQCYKLSLKPETVPDVNIMRESLFLAVNAAVQLSRPIQEKKELAQQRNERDRALRAAQDWEYQSSLRADQERMRKQQEERDAEAQRAHDQEARHRRECEAMAKALEERRKVAERMLSADRQCLEVTDYDFANILLRVAPHNERYRLRVHKAVKMQAFREVIKVLDLLIPKSGGCLWVQESLEDKNRCAVWAESHDEGTERKAWMPDKPVLRPAVGGQSLCDDLSVEQCGLLPNSVIHVHPL